LLTSLLLTAISRAVSAVSELPPRSAVRPKSETQRRPYFTPTMKPLSILVVDDHEIMRDVVCEILEDAGHEVALASDGGDAMDLLGAAHFDVLITDIVMRQMDGIELISEVRKNFPAMKILAMSGGGERFPIVDGLEIASRAGAGAVLKKPFRADELRAAVAHLCPESLAVG
jgi:CheY-like chemotaxis protein